VRAAVILACVVAGGLATASSALATNLPTVTGENIFGTGSTLSAVAQQSVFIPNWEVVGQSATSSRNGVSCAPQAHCQATYTGTGSGAGLAEFGNASAASSSCSGGATAAQLNLNCDPTANGQATPVLDAWVGSDDPPTGPASTAGTNLNNAMLAATGSSSTPVNEITIPVLQAPVAELFSLPVGLHIGCTTVNGVCKYPVLNVKNAAWQGAWDGNVPASLNYAADTWGALLEDSGLKLITTGTPKGTQFTDTGGAGGTGFILNVRSNGSGTTYTQRGALFLSGATGYGSGNVTDNAGFNASNAWPYDTCVNTGGVTPCIQSTNVTTGAQSSGALVSEATETTPGSVGYSNLADSAGLSGAYTPFSATVQNVSNGGAHQILWATLQDNYCGSGSPTCGDQTPAHLPKYAFAAPGKAGVANVYTGSSLDNNGGFGNAYGGSGVGYWNEPGGAEGSWGGTLADDPDVYDHGANPTTGAKSPKYPVVAITYDMAWTKYDQAGSAELAGYGTAADARAVGYAAKSYLEYATAYSGGQAALVASKSYYTKLPLPVDFVAVGAVQTITP
jgi:hypothetical protein